MHAARPVRAGSSTSKPRNEGDAWTQRRTFITFEKTPSRPFEPAGTPAAAASITA